MMYKFPDFRLEQGPYSQLLREQSITTFHEACSWIQQLPYGRISNKEDLNLVLSEKRGTCSSKHGLLALIAEENGHPEIQLMAGVFMMSPETHPELEGFFLGKPYAVLPEMHCYLRYNGERFDLTTPQDRMDRIASKFTREQRIEPHQSGDWKQKIHQLYLQAWLERNPQIPLSFEEIWNDREACIGLLSESEI